VSRSALVFAAFWAAALVPAIAATTPALKCDIGPVNKTYGKSAWLVYSCNDGGTVVFVSAPGNPAMPFYFTLSPGTSGHQLQGEGTGHKEATAAAYGDIKALSQRDIAEIIERTKQVKNGVK